MINSIVPSTTGEPIVRGVLNVHFAGSTIGGTLKMSPEREQQMKPDAGFMETKSPPTKKKERKNTMNSDIAQ
jgi:hypothetical protein